MITPKQFPMTRQNYWRFTVVFVIGIAIIYGVAIFLRFLFGERTTALPVWHWVLGNGIAVVLTEIGMALGGWVSVTDGVLRSRRRALVFGLGYIVALGLLSQQEWVFGINASAGRLTVWLPWVWYLGWLTSMKSNSKGNEGTPANENVV